MFINLRKLYQRKYAGLLNMQMKRLEKNLDKLLDYWEFCCYDNRIVIILCKLSCFSKLHSNIESKYPLTLSICF